MNWNILEWVWRFLVFIVNEYEDVDTRVHSQYNIIEIKMSGRHIPYYALIFPQKSKRCLFYLLSKDICQSWQNPKVMWSGQYITLIVIPSW